MEVTNALRLLEREYGYVTLPEPRTPFASIVWENCAYLVDDETRARTFKALRSSIGITPEKLLEAGAKRIEAAIAGGGMQPARRAAKVMGCADVAMEFADGNLDVALPELEQKARRKLLKRFPGIADPGADKVLLLCGLGDAPALDSNALRVLTRLGIVETGEERYAQAYHEGVAALERAGIAGPKAIQAFALLRAHGRELCKRSAPLCGPCPLRKECPSSAERG